MATRHSRWHVQLLWLGIFMTCIALARVVVAFAAMSMYPGRGHGSATTRLAYELGLDAIPGFLPPPSGDDLRRGDLHEDVVFDGQVVRRDGRLVVLTDADDPDAEEFEPLAEGGTLEEEGPGSLAVAAASVLGGACLFFAGLGVRQLLRPPPAEEPTPPPPEPRPLVVDDRDDDLRL